MTWFQKLGNRHDGHDAHADRVGGVVRTTGSGDGCPDWPAMLGKLGAAVGVPHADRVRVHRLLGVVSLLAVALAVVGVVELSAPVAGDRARPREGRSDGDRARATLRRAGALGGREQRARSGQVTPHFGLAMIVLGVLVAATTLAFEGDERAGDRGYAQVAVIAATATFALLFVGTYVRAEGAGLAFRLAADGRTAGATVRDPRRRGDVRPSGARDPRGGPRALADRARA